MQNAAEKMADQWGLTLLMQIADTGHARIWKVHTSDGYAALKLYQRADRGNEAAGTNLLRLWQDRGAVRILKEVENAVLMEWLEGPSLGDLARDGQLDTAVTTLAETARRLHRTPRVTGTALKPLQAVFEPLFSCQFSPLCADPFRRDMTKAIDLARSLLDHQPVKIALHGDLHPDNIIQTRQGARFFDAKGYLGDPAFELANALRHPKGMPSQVRQSDQIARCLKLYAKAMDVSEHRLAQWAAAKCALSIFWRTDGRIETDHEADLLHLFLMIADQ